jgi:hypothetical protein
MNFNYAQPKLPSPPAAVPGATGAISGLTGFFSRFWAVGLLVILVFGLLIIYYKTVGYYMDFGWNRLWELVSGRDSVKMEVGEGGITGSLKPMDSPPLPQLPPPSERTPGLPGATDSGSYFPNMSLGGKEVFNVSRNIYTYNDASAVCSAFDAELATYDQVKKAHENGADWCNYGWVKGQMAVYPTQKETYEKLQKGAPEFRNACGNVGINGGYFDNPELRFGVNCFGKRPSQAATDELQGSGVQLPQSPEEIEYEKKVQKFREQLTTTTVLPFSRGNWSD